ncbi:C40 family peptidase [Candidatus Micrarchaeota archaeon]|nr:C40 family peptidase [Candidatus Micrarchaeota archaeon]
MENFAEALALEAQKYIGHPSIHYKGPQHGQSPEEGFDCSGFVRFLLLKIRFPFDEAIRHTNEFFDNFGVLVHFGLQERGDLIFFSRDGTYPSHMGIVVERDRYIHSPGRAKEKVCVSKIENEPIPTKIEPAHPKLYSTNPIGFKRLAMKAPQERWYRPVPIHRTQPPLAEKIAR